MTDYAGGSLNSLVYGHILIHSANPKSRPVGIIVFPHVVRPSVSTFQIWKNKTTEINVRYWRDYLVLSEWIIDDTCLVSTYFFFRTTYLTRVTSLTDPLQMTGAVVHAAKSVIWSGIVQGRNRRIWSRKRGNTPRQIDLPTRKRRRRSRTRTLQPRLNSLNDKTRLRSHL